MLINQLAKQTGVSIHTLRFYENAGLIQGVTDEAVKSNNYKSYDEIQVERVEIIKEAKEAGFTLSEIKKILDGWYGKRDKAELTILINAKIVEIDEKINHLKQAQKRLNLIMKEMDNQDC